MVAAFFFFIAWAVPYSPVDDLQWGMEEGLHWWLDGSLNSRYVGNFFAVILCRWTWVKNLLLGGGMFGLVMCMALLAARGQRERFLPVFLFCTAGVLAMPEELWRQVVSWVCGYGNYTISVIFFLVWLLLVRHLEEMDRRPGWGWTAGLFVLCLGMNLFLENQSVLQLGLCVLLAGYALWRRELRAPFWMGLLGSAIGFFLMFFNGIYRDLGGTGQALGGLRELTFSLEDGVLSAAATVLRVYCREMLTGAFAYGVCLALPMAVMATAALWQSPLRLLCPLGLWPLGCHVLWRGGAVPVWAALLAWLIPLAALAVQRDGPRRKLERLALYLSGMAVLLPMAAVNTRGVRLFFFTLVVQILAAADAAAPLLMKKGWTAVTAAALCLCMVHWGAFQLPVAQCTALRAQLIEQAVAQGAEQVVLPTDEYGRTHPWCRNPGSHEFASYFRRFYGIPADMTLVILPGDTASTWPDYTPEQWERRDVWEPCDDFDISLP